MLVLVLLLLESFFLDYTLIHTLIYVCICLWSFWVGCVGVGHEEDTHAVDGFVQRARGGICSSKEEAGYHMDFSAGPLTARAMDQRSAPPRVPSLSTLFLSIIMLYIYLFMYVYLYVLKNTLNFGTDVTENVWYKTS